MQQQIAALPGVSKVGIGSTMPLRTGGIMLDLKAEGHDVAPGEPMPHAEYRTANPDYFKARRHSDCCRAASSPRRIARARRAVVVINKTLADLLFPNQDPIGRRIAWTGEVLKFIGMSAKSGARWSASSANTKDGGLDAAADAGDVHCRSRRERSRPADS